MDKDLQESFDLGYQKKFFSNNPYKMIEGDYEMGWATYEQQKRDKKEAMNEFLESQKIFSPMYRLQKEDD